MDFRKAMGSLPTYAMAAENGWASGHIPRGGCTERFDNTVKRIARRFIRRYGVFIALTALFFSYGYGVAAITRARTTKEVTERVTAEITARYEQEAQAARFAAEADRGEKARQAAMEKEADALAKLLYGYRDNSVRDKKTLVWCALARADSTAYPGTVADVVAQPKQWMFYSEHNQIRDDDRELAMAELESWHKGEYPAGWTSRLVYAAWEKDDIVLRDTWDNTSKTVWWRFTES